MTAIIIVTLAVGIMCTLSELAEAVEPVGHAGMADLPPLLEFANGTVVKSMDAWQERRNEMKMLLSKYYYGYV